MLQPFRVTYIIRSADTKVQLQFGVGAGTRSFKKAVDRNRVKRLVREAWRLRKKSLFQQLEQQNKQMDVFLVYTGRELPTYQEVYDKTGLVIEKLLGKIN